MSTKKEYRSAYDLYQDWLSTPEGMAYEEQPFSQWLKNLLLEEYIKKEKEEVPFRGSFAGSVLKPRAQFVIAFKKKHLCPYCREELTDRPWGRICENLGCSILYVKELQGE